MATITETNAQYYSGQQDLGNLTNTPGDEISITSWNFNTNAISAFDSTGTHVGAASNYTIYYDNGNGYTALSEDLSYVKPNNELVLRDPNSTGYSGYFYIQLKKFAINNNYGNYSYIKLKDVINNFMVGYVGYEKIIPRVTPLSELIFNPPYQTKSPTVIDDEISATGKKIELNQTVFNQASLCFELIFLNNF